MQLWNIATSHGLMHDHHVACLYEWQVVIMCAYEVANMHVSKPCYISMYPSIDDLLRFNASIQHILATLVLIENTLLISSYFRLISLWFSSSLKNLSLAMALLIITFRSNSIQGYLTCWLQVDGLNLHDFQW